MSKNYEMERLHNEIDNAKRAISDAKSTLDYINLRRNPIKNEISSIKYRIDDYKRQMQNEYDAMHYCYQAHDKYSAENHKYNAQSWRASIQRERDTLNYQYDQLNSFKYEYDAALSKLRSANERKKQAYNELNRLKEQDNLMWTEKPCRVCGSMIRYRKDWDHIPNVCKACKR